MLQGPDFSEPNAISVNADNLGIGAALLQADDENKIHPVSYYSQKFFKHQKAYCTIGKKKP